MWLVHIKTLILFWGTKSTTAGQPQIFISIAMEQLINQKN